MSDPRQRLDTPRTSRRPSLKFDQEAVGRYSEAIARFLGTGRYLLWQTVLVIVWITVNLFAVSLRWDPYPFILLNLVLSCIAALQAPVIMMSQNRQEKTDRLHAENDYKINIKAEKEIREIQEKLDHLIQHVHELSQNKQ